MLGRRILLRATESLCARCLTIRIVELPTRSTYPLLQHQHSLHSTPIRKGLLGYLVGDHRLARVHKEIGILLEDYDNAMMRYYKDATQAVNNRLAYKLMM
jgi:hypothetical protein